MAAAISFSPLLVEDCGGLLHLGPSRSLGYPCRSHTIRSIDPHLGAPVPFDQLFRGRVPRRRLQTKTSWCQLILTSLQDLGFKTQGGGFPYYNSLQTKAYPYSNPSDLEDRSAGRSRQLAARVRCWRSWASPPRSSSSPSRSSRRRRSTHLPVTRLG